MIDMKSVTKKYPNGITALSNINTVIKQGEFVYVVGPSGAGKSTFVKLIYREEKPSSGTVMVGGVNISTMKKRSVPALRRKVGVIFQDFKLLPTLTVLENVAFALEVIEENPVHIRQKVLDVLDLVGLKHKARMLPAELSGGEQQRVAIARSIVNNPKVIIADEPTGNLDPDTSWDIVSLLEKINARGTTIVMTTHNKEVVNTMRRRVIAIENGRIVRDEEQGEYGYEA